MSHQAAITALKKYTKVETAEVSSSDFASTMSGESDRGAIILMATAIDDSLLAALKRNMSGLEAKELHSIFELDGLASSFSKRTKLAQAMGIIDRGTRLLIDLIREMRNACAHSRQALTFDSPVIIVALESVFRDEENPVSEWETKRRRGMFCLMTGSLADSVNGFVEDGNRENLDRVLEYLNANARRQALADALRRKHLEQP